MATHSLPRISQAEYLERERSATFRSEYIFGQMYAMAGASLQHNRINRNVLVSLISALAAHKPPEAAPNKRETRRTWPLPASLSCASSSTGCEAVASDQRVYSPTNPFFAYPDIVVYCGEPELMPDAFKDTLMNPSLIVEILSDSTREYDLGLKFEMYKHIPSFREYLAIEQDFVCVHHFRLLESGWEHEKLRSLEDVIRFRCSAGEMSVNAVYRGIEFRS